jgi:hypothetical protein
MRRKPPSKTIFIVVAAATLWLAASGPSLIARALQTVPTPAGQLGGPEPLPTGTARASNEPTATPDSGASDCDVEPVSIEELLIAAAATPAPASDRWAEAIPATAEQTAAARAVIVELIGCANRNDPARSFALYTKDGIARSLARQGLTVQAIPLLVASAGAPMPATAQSRLAAIERVLAADEDHLRAEFALLERSGIGELRAQRYVADLAREGDRWLIEDVQLI